MQQILLTTTPKKTHSKRHSLLLVDDNRLFIATISTELVQAGYNVNSADSVKQAEFWLENNLRPDLVVLDVHMPEGCGLELIDRLNTINHIPFILLTAYDEYEIAEQANRLGAMCYLAKPIDTMEIILAIEAALSRASETY